MLRRLRQAAAAVLACGLLTAALPNASGTVWAAVKNETRTPITSVSITVRSDVKADYDLDAATVYVTTDSSLYTIGAYTWVNGNKEYWEPGDVPKVQIEIHARSGCYFEKTTGAGKFQITGATYASVKRQNNNETLLLTVKLTPASGTLDIPNSAEWVGYPLGKGTWEAVPYAGAYELKLYRDGQMIQGVAKVNATTYDFYPFMTQAGRYQFRVRAIPKDTEEQGYITSGDWVYSDEQDIDDDQTYSQGGGRQNSNLTPANIGWVKNSDGWWYRNANGSYPANTWQNIDGAWYLFDYDGYILTGWQLKNGKYYYLDSNGAMQTGWFQDNRKWYYLSDDGSMQTGWLTLGGSTYYFDGDGSMHTGWLLDSGKWYYFAPDTGAMVRGTSVGGYYLNSDGVWVR